MMQRQSIRMRTHYAVYKIHVFFNDLQMLLKPPAGFLTLSYSVCVAVCGL